MPGYLYDLLTSADDLLASGLSGGAVWLVVPIALALGLRHATDPDHLVAVSALVSVEEPSPRRAMRLGAWWGVGHAATLLLLGLPLVALRASPPSWFDATAEKLIAAVIVALSVRALVHSHRPVRRPVRGPFGAAGVGVVHGLGGTGAIVLMLVAAIPGTGPALLALLLFAPMSVVSMALCSGAVGWALARPGAVAVQAVLLRALALTGIAFGCWYGLASA